MAKNKNSSPRKECTVCKKKLAVEKNFYASNSSMFTDGRVPICKNCLMTMVDIDDISSVKKVLRQIDKPFISHIWDSTYIRGGNVFGNYMRQMNSLMNFSTMTWENSEDWNDRAAKEDNYIKEKSNIRNISSNDVEYLKRKWGSSFPVSELLEFEEQYKALEQSYQIQTASHEQFLKLACISQVKATKAIAQGNTKEAKDYMDMYKNMTQAGKLQPSQMSKADLSGGMDTFGQLARRVEEAVDIVEILPKYKKYPRDSVDFTIYCYVSYIRHLQGLPPIKYEDLYNFYEVMEKEYEESLNTSFVDELMPEDSLNVELVGEDLG